MNTEFKAGTQGEGAVAINNMEEDEKGGIRVVAKRESGPVLNLVQGRVSGGSSRGDSRESLVLESCQVARFITFRHCSLFSRLNQDIPLLSFTCLSDEAGPYQSSSQFRLQTRC